MLSVSITIWQDKRTESKVARQCNLKYRSDFFRAFTRKRTESLGYFVYRSISDRLRPRSLCTKAFLQDSTYKKAFPRCSAWSNSALLSSFLNPSIGETWRSATSQQLLHCRAYPRNLYIHIGIFIIAFPFSTAYILRSQLASISCCGGRIWSSTPPDPLLVEITNLEITFIQEKHY